MKTRALLLIVMGTVASCRTAVPAPSAGHPAPFTPSPGVLSEDVTKTEIPSHDVGRRMPPLPPILFDRLHRSKLEIDREPDNYKKNVEGRPVIITARAGEFLLMDLDQLEAHWYTEKQRMAEVARRYETYINSNAYLLGVDPASQSVQMPRDHVFHAPPMPVRNQSDRLTCVAHASAAALEIRSDVPDDLSEEYAHHSFLSSMNPVVDCCADSVVDALDAAHDLKAQGIPEEAKFKYRDVRPNCRTSTRCESPAHDAALPEVWPRYGINDVIAISGGREGATIGNPAYLESLLESGTNIVFQFGTAFNDPRHRDGENDLGIIDVVCHNGEPLKAVGAHAILLIGYDRSLRIFYGRNSFSDKWGAHDGYSWFSYDYVMTYAIDGYAIESIKVEADPPSVSTLPPPSRSLELVTQFRGAQPSAVAVAGKRVFVSFSRSNDASANALVEVKNGKAVPYPNRWIQTPCADRMEMERLGAVRGLATDNKGRLWVLDTGSPQLKRTSFGGPKLLAIDLERNVVVKRILFRELTFGGDYLNDLRIDSRHGKDGFALITDSTDSEGSVIVVDLASGRSWRRLKGHQSTKPQPSLASIMNYTQAPRRAIDGLTISPDDDRLYYSPLVSDHLYSVSIDALEQPLRSEDDVAATVVAHGIKPISDGIEMDGDGHLYLADLARRTVVRGSANGTYEMLLKAQKLLSPVAVSLSGDYLYALYEGPHNAQLERIRVAPANQ